jgi:Uma2 family endonuclease
MFVSALEQEFGPPLHMSIDEYWPWREQQAQRFEFANGVVFAMTGGSREHNRLVSGLHALLWNAAAGSDCFVSVADMALFIDSANKVYYPDLMVACPGGPDDRFETAPCLVIEVLSPSTQGRDRTVKLADYCSIPTLQSYLMVSSDPADPFVIQHRRAGDIWLHSVHHPGDVIDLTCPNARLVVGSI